MLLAEETRLRPWGNYVLFNLSSPHCDTWLHAHTHTHTHTHAHTHTHTVPQLDQTLHLLDGRESLVRSLREEQEGAAWRAEASEAELRQLNERVCGLQEGLHRVERQRCDLRQQLKLKEESLQVTGHVSRHVPLAVCTRRRRLNAAPHVVSWIVWCWHTAITHTILVVEE